jgi:ribosome-associated protein
MDIKKLQTLVIDALEEVKGQDIRLFDTTHLTSLFDRIAIASGTSNRQTKALAASVRDKVKENGGNVVGMEGDTSGEWVLVDLGDMIVHIMQPAIRSYYRLEEIWGEKEIKPEAKVKRVSKRTASEPATEEKPKATRTRTTKTTKASTEKTEDVAKVAKTTRATKTTKTTKAAKTDDAATSAASEAVAKPRKTTRHIKTQSAE